MGGHPSTFPTLTRLRIVGTPVGQAHADAEAIELYEDLRNRMAAASGRLPHDRRAF